MRFIFSIRHGFLRINESKSNPSLIRVNPWALFYSAFRLKWFIPPPDLLSKLHYRFSGAVEHFVDRLQLRLPGMASVLTFAIRNFAVGAIPSRMRKTPGCPTP